jgi:hypothetical protein
MMAEPGPKRLPPYKGNSLRPWGKCARTGKPHVGAIVVCSCSARRPYSLDVAAPRGLRRDAA